MCLACSFPSAEGHWSEAGTEGGRAGLRQDRMLEMLRRLLAADGLTIRRAGPHAGFIVATPSGRAGRAATVDEVWPLVQRLTGWTIDPLKVPLSPPNNGTTP